MTEQKWKRVRSMGSIADRADQKKVKTTVLESSTHAPTLGASVVPSTVRLHREDYRSFKNTVSNDAKLIMAPEYIHVAVLGLDLPKTILNTDQLAQIKNAIANKIAQECERSINL